MDHAEDVVHTRRRVVKGHASMLWVVVLVGVAECGMMGTVMIFAGFLPFSF